MLTKKPTLNLFARKENWNHDEIPVLFLDLLTTGDDIGEDPLICLLY